MHIAFKFEYVHDNGLFDRLLLRLEELSTIEISLHKDDDHYRIEATGEQKKLEELAEIVSSTIPNSLFLKDYAIEEIETRTTDLSKPIDESTYFEVPYCPECHVEVIKTLDPYVPCKVCGSSDTDLSFEALKRSTGIDEKDAPALITHLADILIEKRELAIETYNRKRTFSLLESAGSSERGILICDPSDLSSSFVITKGELDALMMIERPTVRLRAKLMFRSQYDMNKAFYPVFFADDKVTLALSEVLRRKGIKAVYADAIPTLRVASTMEQHHIINDGRDMLPWRHPKSLDTASICRLQGIEAIGGDNSLIVQRQSSNTKGSYLLFAEKNDRQAPSTAIRFERGHAALRSIVLENDLSGNSLCGIYLSRGNDSQICSFSTKVGYTTMVDIAQSIPLRPKEILEAIAEMDESGARLIENYKKTLPELAEKIEKMSFEEDETASVIVRTWANAAAIIGLYTGSDLHEAFSSLEATAIEFNGKSGPRIDHKVTSTKDGYGLDMFSAIRSAISFKLAGVDEYLISFGFIDSLADFIALQAESADANIGITGVTLSGDLFENRQLMMRAYNAISANFPIYRNQRLGTDGPNIAVGAITLGSE